MKQTLTFLACLFACCSLMAQRWINPFSTNQATGYPTAGQYGVFDGSKWVFGTAGNATNFVGLIWPTNFSILANVVTNSGATNFIADAAGGQGVYQKLMMTNNQAWTVYSNGPGPVAVWCRNYSGSTLTVQFPTNWGFGLIEKNTWFTLSGVKFNATVTNGTGFRFSAVGYDSGATVQTNVTASFSYTWE